MITMLTVLLYFGLILEHRTAVQAGLLPKPIIWADPGSMIALYKPVIIWCQGSSEAQEYLLHKERSNNPWDKVLPLETRNKAKFYIDLMTASYAGIYKCYYKSAAGFSEHSDDMELVMTGAYENPSLSVWPSPDVTSRVPIAFNCSSSIGFSRFILIQEEKYNLSWILDSQHQANQPFYATFVLDAVTPKHSGTFRCYGSFRNEPQVWSQSSNPLDLMVSDSVDQSPTHIEDEAPASHHQDHTVENLIRMVLAALVLMTLVILLLEAWNFKKVEQDETRTFCKETYSTDRFNFTWLPQGIHCGSQCEKALREFFPPGLILEHRTAVQAGLLPKPIIWAEPGSMIALYKPVIIWCQGLSEAQEYLLLKNQSKNPWDKQVPLETRNKAKFSIEYMTATYADIYKCYYKTAAGFSEHSDAMELVMTGAYENPSLSIWPSPDVTSGVPIAFNCSSSIRFGKFILIQEGNYNLSWIVYSQHQANQSFYATFVLDAVTPNHNGTFRCYGSFRNEPQIWSKSSNPLDLMVSDSVDQSPTHIEDEAPASHHQDHTVENLIRMVLAALVLVTLVILLLEAWNFKKVEQDATRT
ncbi:leukocyte immunoglobulin-like receptor subfamily A member 6 [Arvicanthis niloticus]|uniref:leukocyte immunoglobulin-like receptor subfamily A member 6 n=1 Tax=Arvicanthis niloticus TaxID=61156 RepID=UPI00402B8FF6